MTILSQKGQAMLYRALLFLSLLATIALAQPAPPSAAEREAGFLFRQGLELLEQGQHIRATELFRQALRLEPERLEIRPYLARSLFEGQEFEPALRQVELYLDQEPKDPKVALFRVRLLTALERYGQANDALGLLAVAYGDSSWEWQNLKGFLAEKQEQYDIAEAAYQKAAELSTDSFEPDANLVALYLKQKKLDEATALVTELLSQAPDNPQVLNVFAMLLAEKERGFDPAPLIDRLKDQSLPFELQYNFAAALAERASLNEAALLAADLVDRNPDDARASWLYGRILLQQRELQDAGQYLLAARDRLPLTLELASTMGTYAYLTGDYAEAVRWFSEAMLREPENGLWPHNLSLALSRQDKLDEAIASSRAALALLQNDPRIIYQLALVLDRNGEAEAAIKIYQRFLEVNEDAEQASIVREHISELKQQL
jgi:tetratricopeptide (TPR) repeat protein